MKEDVELLLEEMQFLLETCQQYKGSQVAANKAGTYNLIVKSLTLILQKEELRTNSKSLALLQEPETKPVLSTFQRLWKLIKLT